MTLAPGSRLGPYEIVAPLGAGGMGEVYRAKDPRLGREVAIKVLPPEVATDPERLRRFEQEAKAVSALNHPHIVTLYEVGQSEHGPYLVLERIEGSSLRELLRDGALPVKRLLTLGAQIAEGLAKAHAAGIVHRDLKPENVMVTADGFAKILDFGLAKLVYPELEAGAIGEATTLAEKTGTGMIVGTLGYLSPEQAVGKPADFRSDQFALGALLYELATGERPFKRETVPESLAAVIREEPEPLRTRSAALPPQLGWIIERCLAKKPDDRYASTRDLAHDLADLKEHLSEIGRVSAETPPGQPRPRLVRRLAWPLVALALAAVVVWQLASRPRAAGLRPLTYRQLTFQRGVVTGARFSPDGQTVYYSAAFGAEPPRVFMTRLEGSGSVPLEMPPATLLSVSKSGELAVLLSEGRSSHVSSGTLARASALGGTPRPLLDGVIDADWTPDGERLAVLRDNYDIELPAGHVVVPHDAQWPRVSPRGDRIAYMTADGVRVADLEGRTVLDHKFWVFGLAWRPDGREVWFTGDPSGSGSDRPLYALSLSGERRLLAAAPGALTIEDIARDGTRALVTTGSGWWGIQARGAEQAAETTLDLFGRPQLFGLSEDGQQALLYEYRAAGRGTYLRSTDGARTIRLSDDPALGLSPDGAWALTQRDQDPAHLFLIPTGAGEPQTLALDPALRPRGRAQWSRDGRQLFVALAPASAADDAARIYRFDPPTGWRPVTAPGIAGRFAVSPDGRAVAALDGTGSLVIAPTDGGEPRTIVKGVGDPIQWSSDGAWIYLLTKKPFRAEITRLDVASGRIEAWRELGPSDPAGVSIIGDVFLSSDGRSYAYSYSRNFSVLYLAEGFE